MAGGDETAAQRLLALARRRLQMTDADDVAFAHALGLVSAAGYKTPAARTQAEVSNIRKLRNWQRGKNAPEFEPTMRILSRAGLLAQEAFDAFWDGDGRGVELAAARRALEHGNDQGARKRRTRGA